MGRLFGVFFRTSAWSCVLSKDEVGTTLNQKVQQTILKTFSHVLNTRKKVSK